MYGRLLSLSAALLLASGVLSPVAQASSDNAPERRGGAVKLRFDFDNGESLRAGTRVRNVAGRPHGVVHVDDGGRIRVVRGVRGKAARFPQACAGCGWALIEVADRRSLDPRLRKLKFGLDVKVTSGQRAHRSNLLQKGFYKSAGGQYKIQLDDGRPSCVISGSAGRVKAFASRVIPVKKWRRITCKRVGSSVVLRVNGNIWASAVGATGHISNASPVRVGAKKLGVASVEQYHGRLDNVFIRLKG